MTRTYRQLVELQWRLADAAQVRERQHPKLARPLPKVPRGMKLLQRPAQALVEDPRVVRATFARWLFLRLWLAHRRPALDALRTLLQRQRGYVLWQAALLREQRGEPLPLRAGLTKPDVPTIALRRPPQAERRDASRGHTHAEAAADEMRATGDEADAYDLNAAIDWWLQNGDLSELTAADAAALADVIDVRALGAATGDGLALPDILSGLSGAGYSDLQVLQLLDSAWNGQATLWAGSDIFSAAGIHGAFDIKDPYFLDYLRQQAGYQVVGIDQTTRSFIGEAMWTLSGGLDGVTRTYSVDAQARVLRGWANAMGNELRDISPYRANVIATTEMARAETFGTFVSLWQTGVRQKIWMVTSGACRICLANADAGAIDLTDSFPSGVQAPPAHPLCFPAGTIAGGPKPLGSTERWYEGRLVEIRTAGGQFLSSTPNHPILTTRGWVPAGLLKKGDHVICGSLSETAPSTVHPDDYQAPAFIEQVAKSLGGAGSVAARAVPGATEQFHGDGLDGQVSIVRTNRLLGSRLQAALTQPQLHQALTGRDMRLASLVGAGNGTSALERLPLAEIGRVGKRRVPSILLRRALRHHQAIRRGWVADLDALSQQNLANGAPSNTVRSRQGALGHTSRVVGADRTRVQHRAWSLSQLNVSPAQDPIDDIDTYRTVGGNAATRLTGEVARDDVFGGQPTVTRQHTRNTSLAQRFVDHAAVERVPRGEAVNGLTGPIGVDNLGRNIDLHRTTPHTMLTDAVVDEREAYAIPSRQSLARFAGEVTTDEIVSVDTRDFAGHVYNLQTTTGWYVASGSIPQSRNGRGIVVHNCRCDVTGAISDTFNPDEWTPRSAGDLLPLLFNQAGSVWPNVDLPDDLDAARIALSAVQRAESGRRGAEPEEALRERLVSATADAAEAWLKQLRLTTPTNEAALRALTRREPDEHTQQADADYWHAIQERFAALLGSGR